MDKNVFDSIKFGIKFLQLWGVKTYGYFGDTIDRLVKSLYTGNIDELEFTQIFEDLLDGQLRDAWYEGMAQNGLAENDMTQEFETELGGILSGEHDQISAFSDAILAAKDAGTSIDPLISRGELWQSRYTDVMNRAAVFTGKATDNYVWVLGETEQHCDTCAALNEVVASAADWLESGIHPQQPPNDVLDCGGWRCDCRLEKTDAPPTPGGIPNA